MDTKLRKSTWGSRIAALLLLAAAVAFTIYSWKPSLVTRAIRPAEAPAASRAHEIKAEYYCPMHPQQRSDKPGNCPICNMKMVPLEETAAGVESAIHINPARQQLTGVRIEAAAVRPLSWEIRTAGKVAFDESKISHIHTKVAGFIEHVHVDYVGRTVKQGEPLFTLYSPEMVATQEEYLVALKSRQVLQGSSFPWITRGSEDLVTAARRRLSLWDISEDQIQALETTGKATRALTIYSPVSGVVTERAAYHHGRYVTPETDLYTIVDLSSVWVLGDVYEQDMPHVRVGQTVSVELPFAGRTRARAGRVSFLSPTLNAQTRTVPVRVELPNPDLTLRPETWVNFSLRVELGNRLAVPEDAVLDTGADQYVFVDQGEGHFEPRRVQAGAQANGWREIISGLRAGERVATAANFLLDSESRLKGVFPGLGKPAAATDPHAGHKQ